MTLRIVLIALMPVTPARSAARLGSSMCVTFGVIFAHTGFVAAPITQPQTSSRISGFSPIAAPILRSGRPCGQEKFSSKPSTPAAWQRSMISTHASLSILLHDRGDEHAVGELVLALLEFLQPDLERPVADQFDVFPADDFLAVAGHELGVARRDIDDLRGIEADRLGNDRAPAFLEGAGDDVEIRPRRTGADDERIGELETIDGGGERGHRIARLNAFSAPLA